MIDRRTPIARSTKPIKRTPLPARTKPIPKVGAKAKREAAALDQFRYVVRTRAQGRCQGRTPACPVGPHPGAHAHHVRPKGRGGKNDPANGVYLCAAGHAWVHGHPKLATARGLLAIAG